MLNLTLLNHIITTYKNLHCTVKEKSCFQKHIFFRKNRSELVSGCFQYFNTSCLLCKAEIHSYKYNKIILFLGIYEVSIQNGRTFYSVCLFHEKA